MVLGYAVVAVSTRVAAVTTESVRMPRFSRKRRRTGRRRHSRRDGGSIFIGGKTILRVPNDPMNDTFSDGGIITSSGGAADLSANVTSCPTQPNQYVLLETDVVGEKIVSGILGRYNFDFTRWLTANLAQQWVLTAAPISIFNLMGFFRTAKLGNAYMTIRVLGPRDQTGFTWWNTDGGGSANPNPVSMGPRKVKMHYLYLSPAEASYFVIANDKKTFMADPRRKTRVLMQGRSYRFRFSALKFLPSSRLHSYIRDHATGVTGEQDKMQNIYFSERSRRLGWVRTQFLIQGSPPASLPLPAGASGGQPGGPGLGSQLFRLVSKTLVVLFEEDLYGRLLAAVIPNSAVPGSPTVTYFPSYLSDMIIRREEYCSIRLRGCTLGNAATLAGIGQIITTKPWNQQYAAVGVTPNVPELFVPPQYWSSNNQAGYPPLFRLGDDPQATVAESTTVPLHIETASIPYLLGPPVPAATLP